MQSLYAVNEFDSIVMRGLTYQILEREVVLRAYGKKLIIKWDEIEPFLDELWNIIDNHEEIFSDVYKVFYILSKRYVKLGRRFCIQWEEINGFADELWEVWDCYGRKEAIK